MEQGIRLSQRTFLLRQVTQLRGFRIGPPLGDVPDTTVAPGGITVAPAGMREEGKVVGLSGRGVKPSAGARTAGAVVEPGGTSDEGTVVGGCDEGVSSPPPGLETAEAELDGLAKDAMTGEQRRTGPRARRVLPRVV